MFQSVFPELVKTVLAAPVALVLFSVPAARAADGLAPDHAKRIRRLFGETLEYRISWFGIHAGKAVLSVRSDILEGRETIRFSGTVTSARWFKFIYFVRDHVDAYVDSETLRPLLIRVDYREGKTYRRKADYRFDYESGRIVAPGDRHASDRAFPENFTDMFGAFYYLRTFDFSRRKSVSRVVSDGRKFYRVSASFHGTKTIDSILGERECLVVRPRHVRLDLFGTSQNPDRLTLFLTNDRRRIPLKAVGDIRIGSLVAALIKRTRLPPAR
jgi:hypothetical protein